MLLDVRRGWSRTQLSRRAVRTGESAADGHTGRVPSRVDGTVVAAICPRSPLVRTD